MKRALAPVVLVLLLGLSGCVSVETSESQVEVTPGTAGTYSDGDSTVVVEPLTAKTPDPAVNGDEATFLSDVREDLPANTVIPEATDEQLVEAGMKVCSLKEQGVNPDDWTVIEGEQRSSLGYYNDTAAIAKAAIASLC